MTIMKAMRAVEQTSKRVTPITDILNGVKGAREAFPSARPRAKTLLELGR